MAKCFKLSPTGDLLSKFSRKDGRQRILRKLLVDEYGRIFVTDLSKKSIIQVFDFKRHHLSDVPGII